MNSRETPPPWVLVCGGFHTRGAMDRMNLALAEHLLAAGRDVHLVAHHVDASVQGRRGVHVHPVPRLGAVAAGDVLLDRTGRTIARKVRARAPGARVIVNGGNCAATDVNWVHAVHHAWPSGERVGPPGRRIIDGFQRRWFRRRERRAIRAARVVIANSTRTRDDLINLLGVPSDRIHVITPGADPSWRPPSPEERNEARASLDVRGPGVLFMGVLGADDNKGFGGVLSAWRALCVGPSWPGTLLVAGTGPLLSFWKRRVADAGLSSRVRFLNFVSESRRVFSASDVLLSASRYEAYGLAIAEALCRGVPAILPESAGIAAELGAECRGLVVRAPLDERTLTEALSRWAADPARWRVAAAQAGAKLRQHTLDDMAAAIVSVAEA